MRLEMLDIKIRLAIIIMVLPLFSLGQDSLKIFPVHEDQPIWNNLEGMYSIPCCVEETMAYKTAPADSFCNYNYYPIIIDSSTNSFYNLPDTVGYYRIFDKKVFIRKDTNCSQKEYLMYDFTMNIGDTVFCGFNLPVTGEQDSTQFALIQIDTIVLNNKSSRRLRMSYKEYPDNPDGLWREMYWIEGIGSTVHSFYPLRPIGDHLESFYSLLCYSEKDTLVYQSGTSCFTGVGVTSIDSDKFKVYPNPFSQKIFIENPLPEPIMLEIFDVLGRSILTKEVSGKEEIKLEKNYKGLLLFRFSNEQNVFYKKVIKY